MDTYKEQIAIKGKRIEVTSIRIDNHEIVVTGKIIKTARIKEEWDDDIENPASLIEKINSSGLHIDIFMFMQRLPESMPKYDYWMEWDNVAAIPISTHKFWLENQLHPNHRNKVRKANKEGVEVKAVEFNDDFVTSIMRILNEVPMRQDSPFLDYGKDFATVKSEHITYVDRSCFLGAYFGGELIGYLKLVFARKFMRTMQILSMIKYRDKATTNALIDAAVKICAEREIPFLVYGKYYYGKAGSHSLREFKSQNGFEHILLPRYYIPLTIWGKIVLKLQLHHGIAGLLPQKLVRLLLDIRKTLYARRVIREG
jgi:hypothetical protein